MTNTPDEAIAHCAAQVGTPFKVGLCKQRTRIAYAVPSDGSGSATEAWHRTDHRLSVPGSLAPRGALLWWTGGANGYGHVAIADGKGGAWSVDIIRSGYWGHVPFAEIGRTWPNLAFAGVSRDIDGVVVVPAPVAEKPVAPTSTPTIADCLAALKRLAAKSANPSAAKYYTTAIRALGAILANDDRAKTPTSVAEVIAALAKHRESATGIKAKTFLTIALTALRPIK